MNDLRPAVVLHGTRYTARLDGDALVLTRRRATHRIPVTAIDRIDARPGRVDVVLLAVGGPAQVYPIAHHNGAAAKAFARTASAALPERAAADRSVDGAALVTTTVDPRGRSPLVKPFDSWRKLLVWFYLAGLVAPFLARALAANPRIASKPALAWLLTLPFTVLAVLGLYAVVSSLRTDWLLYRRGVTVTARVTGHDDDGDTENPSHFARYAFTDAEGADREHTAKDQPGVVRTDTVDICYDPGNPGLVRRRAGLGRGLVWGTFLGLPLTVAAAVLFVGLAGYILAWPYLGGPE
ncbi:DUF3592 domain-containing protein [Kitasatospora sp. NPDC094019]|uniref:DUF3592 domain-containing protein n=1 Tax=Kitasatospora sp. NPDC094019 TaxID=3364091 RepID=UPI0038067538